MASCPSCGGCRVGNSKICFAIAFLLVLGGLGFVIYWFGVRDKYAGTTGQYKSELLDGNFCYTWVGYEVPFHKSLEMCSFSNQTLLDLRPDSRYNASVSLNGTAEFLQWLKMYHEVIFYSHSNHTIWTASGPNNPNGHFVTIYSDLPMKFSAGSTERNHTYICQKPMDYGCVTSGGGEPYIDW